MQKFLLYIALALLAIPISGLYGIMHDQVTYTISHEYFTEFKFQQFGLMGMNLPDRARVAIVGWEATWWMGIPVGLLTAGAGMVQRNLREMGRVTLQSYGLLITFTFFVGLLGLIYGWWDTRGLHLADGRARRFIAVGDMHNASYLGGLLSIPVAWMFQIAMKSRSNKRPEAPREPVSTS